MLLLFSFPVHKTSKGSAMQRNHSYAKKVTELRSAISRLWTARRKEKGKEGNEKTRAGSRKGMH